MWSVKRVAVASFLTLGLATGLGVGCAELPPILKEAGRGAVAGAGAAGKQAALERIDKAVADGKVSAAQAEEMKALVDALPNPEVPASPAENGVVYGFAFLVAKILGDSLKGLVRRKLDKSA